MLVIVLMIIFWNYKKIQKVNITIFSGFILLSAIDAAVLFKTTKEITDTFYILGIFGAFFLYLLYYFKSVLHRTVKSNFYFWWFSG